MKSVALVDQYGKPLTGSGVLNVQLTGSNATIPVATGQNPAPISSITNVSVPAGTTYQSPSVSTTGLTATVAKSAVKLTTASSSIAANVALYTLVADQAEFINFNGAAISNTTATGTFSLNDGNGAQLCGGLLVRLQLTNHDTTNAITINSGAVYLH